MGADLRPEILKEPDQGGNAGYGDHPSFWHIAEIILYDKRLSNAELKALKQYLKHVYKTAG